MERKRGSRKRWREREVVERGGEKERYQRQVERKRDSRERWREREVGLLCGNTVGLNQGK